MDASWLMKLLINSLRGIFYRVFLNRYLELDPAVTTEAINALLPLMVLAHLAEEIPGEKSRIEAFLRKAFCSYFD